MGNSNTSFSRAFDRQEKYVNGEIGTIDRSKAYVGYNKSDKYSEYQIRNKLRDEYHRQSNTNDYILSSDWQRIRGKGSVNSPYRSPSRNIEPFSWARR